MASSFSRSLNNSANELTASSIQLSAKTGLRTHGHVYILAYYSSTLQVGMDELQKAERPRNDMQIVNMCVHSSEPSTETLTPKWSRGLYSTSVEAGDVDKSRLHEVWSEVC